MKQNRPKNANHYCTFFFLSQKLFTLFFLYINVRKYGDFVVCLFVLNVFHLLFVKEILYSSRIFDNFKIDVICRKNLYVTTILIIHYLTIGLTVKAVALLQPKCLGPRPAQDWFVWSTNNYSLFGYHFVPMNCPYKAFLTWYWRKPA